MSNKKHFSFAYSNLDGIPLVSCYFLFDDEDKEVFKKYEKFRDEVILEKTEHTVKDYVNELFFDNVDENGLIHFEEKGDEYHISADSKIINAPTISSACSTDSGRSEEVSFQVLISGKKVDEWKAAQLVLCFEDRYFNIRGDFYHLIRYKNLGFFPSYNFEATIISERNNSIVNTTVSFSIEELRALKEIDVKQYRERFEGMTHLFRCFPIDGRIDNVLKDILCSHDYEYNTSKLRQKMIEEVTEILKVIFKYDSYYHNCNFKVICDETNNTADLINANNGAIDVVWQEYHSFKTHYIRRTRF